MSEYIATIKHEPADSKQVWVKIENFNGYEVSNDGMVRSWLPIRNFAKPPSEPRLLKCKKDKDGYRIAVLYRERKHYHLRVAALVCIAFYGKRPSNKHVVRHLDGSKTNDVLSNLAWGTYKENSQDMIDHGTRVNGSKVNTAKLNEDDVKAIRESNLSCTQLAKIYPVNISMISKIRLRHNWGQVA